MENYEKVWDISACCTTLVALTFVLSFIIAKLKTELISKHKAAMVITSVWVYSMKIETVAVGTDKRKLYNSKKG